jgi:hypothetical protein
MNQKAHEMTLDRVVQSSGKIEITRSRVTHRDEITASRLLITSYESLRVTQGQSAKAEARGDAMGSAGTNSGVALPSIRTGMKASSCCRMREETACLITTDDGHTAKTEGDP